MFCSIQNKMFYNLFKLMRQYIFQGLRLIYSILIQCNFDPTTLIDPVCAPEKIVPRRLAESSLSGVPILSLFPSSPPRHGGTGHGARRRRNAFLMSSAEFIFHCVTSNISSGRDGQDHRNRSVTATTNDFDNADAFFVLTFS